jgi:hypothetical protein
MRVRVAGKGEISIEELETMINAFMNGDGPEPEIRGTADERAALMHHVASTADAQRLAAFSAFIAQHGRNKSEPS